MAERLLIRGGDVIDTEPEPVLHRGADVLVDDGVIVAVGPHIDAVLDALNESGIRAVLGYGHPIQNDAEHDPDEVRRVRDLLGDGTGLLTMALAPVGPAFEPMDVVERDWLLADELGVPIVVHIGSGPAQQHPVEALRQRDLLRANTLYVHGNSLADSELVLIAESGAAVSITPAVEAQMGHGAPMVNRLRAAGITTGLGVDVVTTVAGDMFSLM